MITFLNNKGFIYNKNKDANGRSNMKYEAHFVDELVEQNSNSTSGSVGFSYSQSIYKYYNSNKTSLNLAVDQWNPSYSYNTYTYFNDHSLRPLFLFKE